MNTTLVRAQNIRLRVVCWHRARVILGRVTKMRRERRGWKIAIESERATTLAASAGYAAAMREAAELRADLVRTRAALERESRKSIDLAQKLYSAQEKAVRANADDRKELAGRANEAWDALAVERAKVAALTAERDQLRAELERERAAGGETLIAQAALGRETLRAQRAEDWSQACEEMADMRHDELRDAEQQRDAMREALRGLLFILDDLLPAYQNERAGKCDAGCLCAKCRRIERARLAIAAAEAALGEVPA